MAALDAPAIGVSDDDQVGDLQRGDREFHRGGGAVRFSVRRVRRHKAGDVALPGEDDVNIDVKRGVDASEIAAIVTAAMPKPQPESPKKQGPSWTWKEMAVLGASLLGGGIYSWNQKPTAPVVAPALPTSPVDSEYDVRFYDKDGNLIHIPQIDPPKK